ncbi:thiamine pyrophosphate-binding protein [Mucilaginibacter sp.]|uniref:thiamine pyrophosphate-binding protein n=1 Tax=Mucilaginibacter sp. TaxID=1882438 RepID=UPI003AFF7DDF
MKVSDFIAEFLQKKGIKSVFELSGGMITHLLDSISQKTDIHIYTMHHEQSAAFAAEACGRITGLPGIALATSGPGATNLLTGIGSCFFDSSPAIFITGQVNRHEQKGKRNIRQLGFQETDIVTMAKPVTKASFQIDDPARVEQIFEDAYRIALEGRPGPVLIDIPMDIQRAQIEPQYKEQAQDNYVTVKDEVIKQLVLDLKKAKNPLILAGRGIKASGSQTFFSEFIVHTKIPVVTTLLGIDTISYDHPQRVGFIGSYGNRWANMAIGECDLLVVLGSRLDIRQTGADVNFFSNRKIYHIDCEIGEINNRIKGCIEISADLKSFFHHFKDYYGNQTFDVKTEWIKQINSLKEAWPDVKELSPKGINPNEFIHSLSKVSKAAKAYLADVGSHQMWCAQSIELEEGQYFLTSGGMGAMGFALPASIGTSISLNKNPVVVIIGDGCMQINIQELQTIVRNNLPVKIVVLNNRTLGMIRQFQDTHFESRYQSTYWGYDAPDFAKVALAYGIDSKTIVAPEETEEAVEWFWTEENRHKPQLLQVMIDPHTNTYPKIAFGKPITEMEPFFKPVDMEST